jgi:hypothetical protein
MPFSEYSSKQKKLARIAEPRDAITGADFAALRKKDGGMIKFAEGGDTRRAQLMQLLDDAREKGDDDMIIEIEAELFQMSDDDGMMGGGMVKGRGYRYGGKVKGYRDGMSVSSDTGRGCGAAVKGKAFSGTY